MESRTVSLIASMLLGLSLSVAAYADCATVTVSEGAKVCTLPEHATGNICTSGLTSSLAKFQVYWGATTSIPTVTGGSNEVAGSGVQVASFTADFDSFADPTLFPGYFLICAVNKTTGSITVTLCLHPDVASSCPAAGS